MKRSIHSLLIHYAQGLLMGGSDAIPGVSGGTMALIVGIYERLIDSISKIFTAFISVIRLDFYNVTWNLRQVEWKLIIPLGMGIGTAILLAATVILDLMARYPAQMRGLFFGLVAASIAVPWLRIGRVTVELVIIALIAAVVAFFLVGLPLLSTKDPGLVRVFFSAMIAICAMILPGISGAFLLQAMGMYEPTLEALNARNVVYVLTFIAGAGIGLGTFSTVLDWLIDNYHDRTMAALIGLMAGSLRALWPWMAEDRSLQLPSDGDPVWIVLVLFLLGFSFVSGLTWFGAQRIEASAAHE